MHTSKFCASLNEHDCRVFVFHFMSKSRQKWSELARGGMVEQLQFSVGAKREARLIREVDPLGLTCV